MRFPIEIIRSRHLSRVAVIALLAAFTASCSDSTQRFSADPFSNPFKSGSDQVAYASPQPDYAAPRVRAQPGYAVGTVPANEPIAAQPLPPVGSVSQRAVPQTGYRLNRGEQPIVTGSVSTPAPQIGGFKATGWSAEGGTNVTAQAGEDVNTLSNRYGVPSDAIIKVNGLAGRSLSPGQQVIIPVYNATAKADPVTPVALKSRKVSEEQPYPGDPVAEDSHPSVGAANVRPAGAESAGLHVVKPGETLTSIAKAYGTTRPRLAKANGLDEWATVSIGQKLKVSGAVQAAAPQVTPANHAEQVADTRPPKDIPVAHAIVKPITEVQTRPVVTTKPITAAQNPRAVPHKTVRIAPAKAVPAKAVAEVQPRVMVKPVTTKPVQTANAASTLPKPVAAKPIHVATAAPVAIVKTKPAKVASATIKPADSTKAAKLKAEKLAAAKAKTLKSTEVAQAKPAKPVETPAVSDPASTGTIKPDANLAQGGAAKPTASPTTDAQASSGDPKFRWPVNGHIIQGFGQNSDGINISVPEGTEVKAAEDGVVAYAGNELKGYGNLILIRHPNGYVTAYGHAKDVDVKKGDTVKRGQTIATAGQTGNVTSPQVLFEVRKGAAPVNPVKYLPGN